MNIRLIKCIFVVAISGSLFAQTDPNALAAYLDELRNMSPVQRSSALDSTEFQKTQARHKEIEDTILKPLLTGDLSLYAATLRAGMSDPDPYIRSYTVSLVALATMNPEAVLMPDSDRVKVLTTLVPWVLALTDEAEPRDVRAIALGALQHMALTKNPAIPAAFERAVDDTQAEVRAAGLLGLASIAQEQVHVLEVSLGLLNSDPDVGNRKLVVSILAESPINDSRILPALMAAVDDPHVEVQQVAVNALHRRSPGDRKVSELLRRKLVQPQLNPGVRAQIERDAEVTKQ